MEHTHVYQTLHITFVEGWHRKVFAERAEGDAALVGTSYSGRRLGTIARGGVSVER
jgi:hypothetical protein